MAGCLWRIPGARQPAQCLSTPDIRMRDNALCNTPGRAMFPCGGPCLLCNRERMPKPGFWVVALLDDFVEERQAPCGGYVQLWIFRIRTCGTQARAKSVKHSEAHDFPPAPWSEEKSTNGLGFDQRRDAMDIQADVTSLVDGEGTTRYNASTCALSNRPSLDRGKRHNVPGVYSRGIGSRLTIVGRRKCARQTG